MNMDPDLSKVKAIRPGAPRGASSRAPAVTVAGTVLVVDDNPVIRQIFRTALEQAQFKVTEAASGGPALALLEDGLPALIVLDLMMLEVDGFKFLTHLRRRTEWKAIPVVVLTAKRLTETEEAFVATHAQVCQRKGKNVGDEVVKLVSQFLRPGAG